MKKIIMFLLMLVFLSCVRKEPLEKPISQEPAKTKTARIHVIDNGGWSSLQIVEVDGHLYLCNNSHGGIVHLESCPCKKNNEK